MLFSAFTEPAGDASFSCGEVDTDLYYPEVACGEWQGIALVGRAVLYLNGCRGCLRRRGAGMCGRR